MGKIAAFLLSFFMIKSSSLVAYLPSATQQQILPTGFGYFENLCFETESRTFFARSEKPLDLEKAIYIKERRGFEWKNRPLNCFTKDPEYHPGATLFVFERQATPEHVFHLYHFLEHLIGLWSFKGEQLSCQVSRFVIVGNGNTGPSRTELGSHDLVRHLIRALFPYAQIQLFSEFIEENQNKVLCFEKVLTSDRCMEYMKKEPFRTDRMLGGYFSQVSRESLNHLAKRVQEYSGRSPALSETLRITYVPRSSPRCLSAVCEETLLSRIRALPNVTLTVTDFAALPFKEQLRRASETDILIGVHGNGLSHTLFLPEGATLIELFPHKVLRLEYYLMAKMRGLGYVGIMSGVGLLDDKTFKKTGIMGVTQQVPLESIDIDVMIAYIQQRLLALNQKDF